MSHISVLLKELIEILNPQPGEFLIDGTLGAGGHAKEIIKKISPDGLPAGRQGIFLGLDWDKNAIENFRANLKTKTCNLKTIKLIHANYADIPEILQKNNLSKADGLIIDLGLSSDQLENSGRGFSFQKDEPLDMRFDSKSGRLSVMEIINSFSEKDLADIFWKYGEERNSRKIAKVIVEKRRKNRIKTTFELANVIREVTQTKGKIHPATKIFQALRIYVNDELGNLEKLLGNLENIMAVGGRAGIISFHSLEDRLVKNYFRNLQKSGKAKILTKKPVVPAEEEIKNNKRARSAKLRVLYKI